jgi:hypothetical protein
MTATGPGPGRPRKGTPAPTLTVFGHAITAALRDRREAQREGPRSLSDLASVIGVRLSTLHLQLNGRRPMPAETAAAIRRALPEIGHDGT